MAMVNTMPMPKIAPATKWREDRRAARRQRHREVEQQHRVHRQNRGVANAARNRCAREVTPLAIRFREPSASIGRSTSAPPFAVAQDRDVRNQPM
jgi:hypothetical protein